MAFGKPPGFVENGKDVDGLIQKFHNMAPMAGLVAALPNWVNPLMNAPILGDYLMPTSGDGTGTGKIMQVREFFCHLKTNANRSFSSATTCSKIDSQTATPKPTATS